MWLLASACTESFPDGDGPLPGWDADGAFFDAPFPDDRRRDEDGTVSFAGFPNPAVTLVTDYLERAEQLQGFGTASPVYLPFDAPLDPDRLPSPSDSLGEDSPLILVDIDPDSPHWLERFPVEWELWNYEESYYFAPGLLSVAPMHGFPLRPSTTYALVVTTQVAKRNPDWHAGWEDRPELSAAVEALGLHFEEVAIATTFTTMDPVEEMRRLAWFVREAVGPIPSELRIEHLYDHTTYVSWRTHYQSPVFTFGEAPYTLEGGEFRFDADGTPQISHFDDLRLAVCVPRDLPEPEGGWPVVVFQDGTGGWYRGFCNSDSALEIANRLGAIGFVGLGIDQPLHGIRPGADTANDLNHFNIVNPDSATTNFRQGALDAIYLTHSLAARPQRFVGPDGSAITLDPERVYFMGHSQGGLTGGLATPFFGDDVKGSMLSGAGGVLAITVVERKDPLDFTEIVAALTKLGPDEPLTPMHPVLGLVQTMVEVTDPVNYAPYWYSQRGDWDWQAPVPVLLTNGTDDQATPWETALALATAARLPWVGDTGRGGENLLLRTGPKRPLPTAGDARAFDGEQFTAGFAQFKEGSHWVIYEEPIASDLVFNWFESLADGAGVLTNEPETTNPQRDR
jgi:alpha-beta hydrolase superfamily lysophospholipase